METIVTLKNTEKDLLRAWLRDLINADIAKRATMPVAEQIAEGQLFPISGGQGMPFADAIKIFKYTCSSCELGSDAILNTDLHRVLEREPIEASNVSQWREEAQQNYEKKHPMLEFYAALIDLSAGGYGLTPSEFKQLKCPVTLPKYRDGLELHGIYELRLTSSQPCNILDPLKNADYGEFMALVSEVREELGLPQEIPAEAKTIFFQGEAPSPAPAIIHVNNQGTLDPPAIQQAAGRIKLLEIAEKAASRKLAKATENHERAHAALLKAREALELLKTKEAGAAPPR